MTVETELRPVVETDMRPYESNLDGEWCHVAERSWSTLSMCGSERQQQVPHYGRLVRGVCSGCGLRACPECVLAERERRA